MTAVSDTSPLNYLVLTGADHILPALFTRVVIPQAVLDELTDPRALGPVRSWLNRRPAWLEIRVAPVPGTGLAHLDPGEREAITLAEAFAECLVLLDEAKARRTAIQRGLRVVGTLGLLDHAAARGLIDLQETLERLRQTSFRLHPRLWPKLTGTSGR